MDRSVQYLLFFFLQAEDGIRDGRVTGVQTCALPISGRGAAHGRAGAPGPATPGRRYRRDRVPTRAGAAPSTPAPAKDARPLPAPAAPSRARGPAGAGTPRARRAREPRPSSRSGRDRSALRRSAPPPARPILDL